MEHQRRALWTLPADLEDQFDAHWQDWLDARSEWNAFFDRLEEIASDDLLDALRAFELVSDAVSQLRRSAEGRARYR